MAYVNQLVSDAKQIKSYASGVLENISCLPSVIGDVFGANLVGEFALIALEGIKSNFIAIADNISKQVQRLIGAFTNKLSEVKALAENITNAVCGVEKLLTGLFKDAKDLASSMMNGFGQSGRCQYVGAMIGACIRAKIYNKLSGQLQKKIINSDLYKDLAFGTISGLDSITKQTQQLFSDINVPGISDSFLRSEALRVNRIKLQLSRINGQTVFGSETPTYGANTYRDYNFRYRPYVNYQNIPVQVLAPNNTVITN